MNSPCSGNYRGCLEGLPENNTGIRSAYQWTCDGEFRAELAIALMAQRNYPPSVIIRIGKLDMGAIGCHGKTTNLVTETSLLPSSIFPIFDPVAWSATFLKIMYKICHNVSWVFRLTPAPMGSTSQLLTRVTQMLWNFSHRLLYGKRYAN